MIATHKAVLDIERQLLVEAECGVSDGFEVGGVFKTRGQRSHHKTVQNKTPGTPMSTTWSAEKAKSQLCASQS